MFTNTADTFLNGDDAEEALGVPTLEHLPMIEEKELRLLHDINALAPMMEAYRSLRANIRFVSDAERPLRTLLVTSSVPAEGRSTTIANLATAMALSMGLNEEQVVLVDADLRRPSQHKLFAMGASPGLADVLAGTHTLEAVLRPTSVANLSLVPAGTPPMNPTELLESDAMRRFLADLEKLGDLSLLDSPPLLAVADAAVVAAQVSGVLVVIGAGETKRTSTQKTLQILARAKAPVLGTALNRIKMGRAYYGKNAPSETPQADGSAA